MRIRKNASKILGSASTLLFSAHSSPCSPQKMMTPSDISYTCSDFSSEVFICELNCSPWDLLDPDDDDDFNDNSNFNFNSLENSKEGKEPIIPALTDNTNGVINKQLEKRIRYCKKRGKGWDCKKPSRFPHSFCDYHLAKLRSSKICKPNKVRKNGAFRDKPDKVEAVSESSSYYYYSGFGPWRGKTRVRADVEVEEEEEDVRKVVSGSEKAGDNDDTDDGDNDDGGGGFVAVQERVEVGITYCRKSDGKKWHCKRPAQLPHSALCSHHLAQCRSYNHGYSNAGAHRKIKHATKEVTAECKSRGDGSEAHEVGNADVAGDDEYDAVGCDGEGVGKGEGGNEHGKAAAGEMIRRRRKPMKARSLKSLIL